jgi:hypothetical protein
VISCAQPRPFGTGRRRASTKRWKPAIELTKKEQFIIAAEANAEAVRVSSAAPDTVRGLSKAQQNIQSFVISRLERAAGDVPAPQWNGLASSVRQDAGNLLEQIHSGMPITGKVLEVTNVGSAAESVAAPIPW